MQGSIVEAQSDKDHRWLALDSGGACGEGVHFIRHVVMIVDPGKQVGETLVVLDELVSPAPERVDLLWHTHGKIELAGKKLTGTITGNQAAVRFALAATVEATAATGTRKLSARRADNVLRLTCGLSGTAYLASVFTSAVRCSSS